MITRWHYYFDAVMITRWQYYISVGMITRCHYCRERDGQKEGGGMQCFMKKEDNSLIGVENVVTTGEGCCHLS